MRGDYFSDEEKDRNFDYYEKITVRDSSLSACTQAIIAAEVGHLDLAYDYYGEAALMDLDDREQNTRDGVHIASLAGAWLGAVAGWGGMRDHDGKLTFAPRLPEAITRVAFRILYAGRSLRVDVTTKDTTYELLEGEPFEISHDGEALTVSADKKQVRKTAVIPRRHPAPEQPPGRAPQRRTAEQR